MAVTLDRGSETGHAEDEAGDLADGEFYRRLRLADPEVVDDLYEIAWKQLVAEDALADRISNRAISLFGTAGFSMTLAFSFGGWALLDHTNKVPFGEAIAVVFVVVLFLGVATAGVALAALVLGQDHSWPKEAEIFHEAALGDHAEHRRYVAAHVWRIAHERHQTGQAKAGRVVVGQWCFLFFLIGILGLACMTTISAITRPPEPVPTVGQPVCAGR